MKKFLLLTIVSLLSVMVQAQDWSFAGGTLYFNNAQTQWNDARMMLVIGHESWSSVYEMTAAEEENMWYVALPQTWEGATYMAVESNPGEICSGAWSTSELQYAAHFSAPYTGGIESQSDKSYLLTPQSADNGCELVLTVINGEEEPEEPVVVNWYLTGDFNEWNYTHLFESKEDGEEGILYTTLFNLPQETSYQFKIYNGEWFGNDGIMVEDNHTGWVFGTNGNNCLLITGAEGNYEFAWDTANHMLSVIYPEAIEEPEVPVTNLGWFIEGDFNDWNGDALMPIQEGADNTIYMTKNLQAGKEYDFKIKHHDTWFSAAGLMTQVQHENWYFATYEDANCKLATSIVGDYTFVLDTLTMNLTVVYPSNASQATLYESPVKDNNPDIMLQAFYWAHEGNTANEYTAFGDVKWSALNAEADEIAQNFDLVWLAPSQETADYTGYLPMNYSKQGSFDEMTGHHGHSPWGTGADLRSLIDNLHQGGAKVIADIVLNHTSAGHVDEYAGEDKNWCSWTLNDFGRYGQFQIDRTWITAEDEMFAEDYTPGRIDKWATGDCGSYDKSLLTHDEKEVSYLMGTTQWAYSEYNSTYSRDLAHSKKEVREMSRAYLTWMRDSIGYDGFRYDFMKGMHGSHLADYNTITAPYFSVAEVFEGDIDKQLGFLYDANYQTYVFDFPGKFTYYNGAIRTYQLQNLMSNYSLIRRDKKHTVTFIDNHDSFHEGSCLYGTANTIDDRQAHQALAFLLSMPGVPCVVYPYWNNYKAVCKAFIQARRAAGVHSESEIVNEWAGNGSSGNNYYTAMIKGSKGYLFLKLGYDCNPTDAPMEPSPNGKAWQCAWANRDHAGVWYTVNDATPEVPTNTENAQSAVRVNKIMNDGVMYIQRGDELFTVDGVRVQ